MKYLLIALILGISVFSGLAQDTISIDYQIGEKDTTRNYVLQVDRLEKAIEKLKVAWGKPAIDKAGTVRWLGISIVGYEEKVNITLSDGLLTRKDESRTLYKTFKNQRQKDKRLSKLKENQERYTFVEFKETDNTVLSQDEMDEYFFIETLEDILVPKK